MIKTPYDLRRYFYLLDSKVCWHPNMATAPEKSGASSLLPVKFLDQVRDRIRYKHYSHRWMAEEYFLILLVFLC